MRLSEIATALQARLVGDGSLEIDRPVHPADATSRRDLMLAMDPSTLPLLSGSPARAALVVEGAAIPEGQLQGYIEVARSRYAMAKILDLFERPPHAPPGIHPSAVVAEGARLGPEVSIGPFCYLGPGAEIGAGSRLLAHVTVGADASIGERCLLHPGARIGERVVIGNRVILHHNVSIGADGFSFVTPEVGSVETARETGEVGATNRELVRINSIGTVAIEDDVEIGACSAIDRGTVRATRVGRNTKIDDLVMIGHNCVIGANCMLCGQVGIAGSTEIGDRVVLAGKVGVSDHVKIGSDCVIAAGSLIGHNVPQRSVLMGYPPKPRKEAAAIFFGLLRLPKLIEEVEQLKRRVLPRPQGTDDEA